jgi:hypothetical protein
MEMALTEYLNFHTELKMALMKWQTKDKTVIILTICHLLHFISPAPAGGDNLWCISEKFTKAKLHLILLLTFLSYKNMQ